MSKELTPLDAFKKIFDRLIIVDGNTTRGSIIDYSNLMIIETALKALEIIKEKKVNVGLLLRCKNVERYNNGICYEPKHLTQEEFNILKEVLL